MDKTPRQRRRLKNTEVILDAAFDLITEKGLEQLSLREVARDADYSPAALYKYFENKQALVEALLARENLRLIADLGQVPAELNDRERLVEMCLVYIRFNVENRAYHAMVSNLSASRTEVSTDEERQSPFDVFLNAVREWAAAEQVPLTEEYGAGEITYALWAQVHGMATLRLNQLKDYDADFEGVNRRTIEIYLKGLKG